MKTISAIKSWGTNSPLYWLTLLVAVGILLIRIRFLRIIFIMAEVAELF